MRMILPRPTALLLALAASALVGQGRAENLILAQQNLLTPSPLPPRAQPLPPPTQARPRSSEDTKGGGGSLEDMILRNLGKLQQKEQGEVLGNAKKSDKGKQDSSKP